MSGVFRTIIFDLPPPLPLANVSSPHQRRGEGGTHSPGGEGVVGSIFQKKQGIGLASYSIIPLRLEETHTFFVVLFCPNSPSWNLHVLCLCFSSLCAAGIYIGLYMQADGRRDGPNETTTTKIVGFLQYLIPSENGGNGAVLVLFN